MNVNAKANVRVIVNVNAKARPNASNDQTNCILWNLIPTTDTCSRTFIQTKLKFIPNTYKCVFLLFLYMCVLHTLVSRGD